jgi:hypothetical protein
VADALAPDWFVAWNMNEYNDNPPFSDKPL